MNYGATEDISEDACSFKRLYSIIMDGVFFLQLSQQVSFHLFIFFLLGIDRNARLDFGFPSNFTTSYQATASNLVMFGLAVLLTFFRSLTDGYCFYSSI